MKKILALLIAMMLVLSMGVAVFAEGGTTTGSITIQNATKGHTYTAYKVFDATYNGDAVSYTTPAANESKLDASLFGWSTADANGNISVWALEGVSESDIIDWIKANYASFGGSAIDGEFDAENSTVTFSDLDFGYYYITSTLGTAVTIDTAAPSAEVYDKNFVEPDGPDKTIIKIDGEDQDEVREGNAHVGSVVTFQVTANAVNWTGEKEADGSIETVTDAVQTTEWTFADKATNMDVDLETIVVKVNGEEITNYTAAGDGNGGFTLKMPMVDANNNSIYEAPEDGKIPIEITYDATITANAGKDPAVNEITDVDNPPPPVIIYTYGFQVAKTDDNDDPLPGAQFELWSKMSGDKDTKLTFIDNGDGTYTYSPDGTVTTLDMTTNTTISLLGLDQSWDYTLKEITVPAGYNKADDVDVTGEDLTQIGEYELDAEGYIISYTEIDTSIYSTELYKQTVENKAGVELPSTGSVGTTILYVIGSVLVLAAVVLLVTKRRMTTKD